MKTLLLALAGMSLAALPALAAPSALKNAPSKDTVQVQTLLSASGVADRETNLGDLIADAMRTSGGTPLALIPADEIDGNTRIAAGKADVSAIVAALRYASDPSDTVVVLNLSGTQLLKVAERSVSRAPQSFDGFLQVSGAKVSYDPSQPEGRRISRMEAGGSEVAPSQTYRVAVPRPLAGGSLGYFQILGQKDIAEDTGTPLSKSLEDYLAAHPTISSVIEGRITAQ